ncbi:MAG: DinB family protein [Cyclobacteriaceae bacterium]|nr:DinB family protein [Cyclobacteriaceae bacterium]
MTKEMRSIVDDLNRTIAGFVEKLRTLSEEELRMKPSPEKWSRIEVIGHLIDSAHSNLRRFIVGQYEAAPPHIIYEQDFWVKANAYQHAPVDTVITLWILMNHRIATVLSQMEEKNYDKSCDTGREGRELHSLIWLAADYVKHMKHHLNQVIPNSYPVTYP